MMELKDWIIAGLSAVSATIGVLGYWKGQSSSKITSERALDRLWTLETIRARSGERTAHIHYSSEGPPVRFLSVKAIEPKGLRLSIYSIRTDPDPADSKRRTVVYVPDGAGPRATVNIERDGNPNTINGNSIQILVYMPPKPSWLPPVGASMRLVVRYEDRDAKRARHEIDVWAHDVPWGPSD